MWTWILSCVFLLIVAIESVSEHSSKEKPRIVFVYFMVKTYCEGGLPEYIQHTLNHTLATQQPQSEVVLVSNFRDCFNDTSIVGSLPLYRELAALGLVLTDSTAVVSDRTRRFHNLSREVFAWDNKNELWMTSALRFFILEDVMAAKGWQEALHVEADNLLFARVHTLVPALRQYPLAATPLAATESLVTASVFWVSELRHLRTFTSFLLRLAEGKVDLEAARPPRRPTPRSLRRPPPRQRAPPLLARNVSSAARHTASSARRPVCPSRVQQNAPLRHRAATRSPTTSTSTTSPGCGPSPAARWAASQPTSATWA